MFHNPIATWHFREAGIISEPAVVDDLKWTGLVDFKCSNCGDRCDSPLRVSIKDEPGVECWRDLYLCKFCVAVITM